MKSEEITIAIISVAFLATIVLSIYFIMKFKVLLPARSDDYSSKRAKSDWQKPGIVVLGIGIGVLLVGILNENNLFTNNDAVNTGIVVVSTGISMIMRIIWIKNLNWINRYG